MRPLLLTLSVLTFSLPAAAQLEMMTRTPELERLQVFLGEWQRSPDRAFAGAARPKSAHKKVLWGPGEFWMTWDVRIDFSNGQKVIGRRQIAWDRHGKTYASSWIDSQSAHVIKSKAQWIDEKTFQIQCDPIPWSDGHAYRFRTQYRFESPTKIRETGFKSVDGGEFKKHSQAVWTKKEDEEP